MIGEIIVLLEEIMFLRQEIQDLRERVNLEKEISLEQKINALTQDTQYIKAKLNAMKK
jgi:regulator of replication initiation timing